MPKKTLTPFEVTTQELIKLQDLLDNDQTLEFIKLTRKVPTGLHPKSKDDIDNITTVLYKEMPRKWPRNLKKNFFITLNQIRLTFELPLFKDYTNLIIFSLILVLVLISLLCYFLFKRS